jgi:SNF2 family DNA or RNA helicase
MSTESESTTEDLTELTDVAVSRWIDGTRDYDLEPLGRIAARRGKVDAKSIDTYTKKKYLEPVHTRCDHLSDFKMTLMEHQQRTVQAMLDIEIQRYIKVNLRANVKESSLHAAQTIGAPLVETCAGVLSERFGSGKTIEVIALICSHKRYLERMDTANGGPGIRKYPEITHLPVYGGKPVGNVKQSKNIYSEFIWSGFTPEVRRVYRTTLPQTIVFAGRVPIRQWQEDAENFSDLRCWLIENVFHMRELYECVFDPQGKNTRERLMKYDIVLVKNGKISGKFDPPELEGTHIYGKTSKNIMTVFGELFKNICFQRVVLDDFDQLGVPADSLVVPAIFTWFVSATKKTPNTGRSIKYPKRLQDLLFKYRPTYQSVWSNQELFTFFNVSCEESFITESTEASKVRYFVYKFDNPHGEFTGLIGTLGEEGQNIMEMLNAGADGAAAKEGGMTENEMKSGNLCMNLFSKILGKKWDIYYKALEIDAYIPRVRKYLESLPELPKGKSAPTPVLKALRKNIKTPGPFSAVKENIKKTSHNIQTMIDRIDDKNLELRTETGKALQRVKDNLREGDCPITCEPLAECEIIIMKCCGCVMSVEGAKMMFEGAYKATCGNCRSPVTRDTVEPVDPKITIEEIINEDIGIPDLTEDAVDATATETELDELDELDDLDELTELTEPAELYEDAETDVDRARRETLERMEDEGLNKINTVIYLALGMDDMLAEKREERTDISIPNLLEGRYDKGEPNKMKLKVLVYNKYADFFKSLEPKLNALGIAYETLTGSVRATAEIKRRYHLNYDHPNAINVLFIKGPKYCAGANLQNTHRLIFTHKEMERSTEEQMAGRAARFGRTTNLEIHYILFENEYAEMLGARVADGETT